MCRGNARLLLVGFQTLPSIREPFLHVPAPYSDENKSAAFTSFLSPVSSTHTFLLSDQFENYVFWFFSSYSFDFFWKAQAHNSLENAIQHVSTWKRCQGSEKKKTATYRKTSFVMRSRLSGFLLSDNFSNNRRVCCAYRPVITVRAIKRYYRFPNNLVIRWNRSSADFKLMYYTGMAGRRRSQVGRRVFCLDQWQIAFYGCVESADSKNWRLKTSRLIKFAQFLNKFQETTVKWKSLKILRNLFFDLKITSAPLRIHATQ